MTADDKPLYYFQCLACNYNSTSADQLSTIEVPRHIYPICANSDCGQMTFYKASKKQIEAIKGRKRAWIISVEDHISEWTVVDIKEVSD